MEQTQAYPNHVANNCAYPRPRFGGAGAPFQPYGQGVGSFHFATYPRVNPVLKRPTPIVMEEVTDPAELAEARALRARFDRNSAWLEAHAAEVYSRCRGKCICIAGAKLFVGDSPGEALALATKAHPEDDGRFVQYIPLEKVLRIYAHQRAVVSLS